jgi:gliding motility-associated protein GldL
MGLFTLVRRRGFRNFMARLYGLGASVVMLGALFKINHYPGADYMLVVGLCTESIIFFFSAWEPPYVEPDWSLVYPELAGLYHGSGEMHKKPTAELDDMLEKADIDQKLIDRLGQGLKRLSENTTHLSDISSAASANNEYVEKVKVASKSVESLAKSYDMTSESLQKDANVTGQFMDTVKGASDNVAELSQTYKTAAETLKGDISINKDFTGSMKQAMDSANNLAEQYTRSAEMLSQSAQKLDFSAVDGKGYNEQLQKISEKLAALNSMYELQLQTSNEQVQSSNKVRETMNEFLKTMQESAAMMGTYKSQMGELTDRLAALNEIYGSMLTAMGGRGK